MRTASRRRTWRPHPLFTRDLWHDIAPIGIGILAAVLIGGICHATGTDVRSILDDVGVIHVVGLAVALFSVHLLVTHAPTWFVRRRLRYLHGRRDVVKGQMALIRLRTLHFGDDTRSVTTSSRRKIPRELRPLVRRYHRLTRAIERLQAYERSLTRPSS